MEKLGTYSVMEFRAVCKMSNIPATSTGHLGLIGCSLEPKQDSKTTWLGGMWPTWSHCSSKCGRRPRARRRSEARGRHGWHAVPT